MPHRKRVGVLVGGRSTEHEVSMRSGQNVVRAVATDRFDPIVIGIDHSGQWYLLDRERFLESPQPTIEECQATNGLLALVPGRGNESLLFYYEPEHALRIDLFFPVLHGSYGEDGSIQGVLRSLDLPFVGPDLLGSALGIDKEVMKRLLLQAGLPTARYKSVRKGDTRLPDYTQFSAELGSTLFVKPATLGSSVGVSRATDAASFEQALSEAFRFDRKVIIEEAIVGQEVEVALLGASGALRASVVGEVIAHTDFYSYESKYLNAEATDLAIPARLSQEVSCQLQQMAVDCCEVLECEGMTRVDFFVVDGQRIFINEVNTLPGFTNISMYPMLWRESGLTPEELVSELLDHAIRRHGDLSALTTRY